MMFTPPSTYSVSPDSRRAYGVARNAQVNPTSMMSTSSPMRRALRRFVEQQVEVLEAGGGARLERPRRDRVHPDVLAAQLVREIAAARLERRLHRTHHVVVRHHLVGAVVAHREHGAAVLHERRGEPRHAHEGMAGHVHRLGESFRGAIEKAALQVLLRREGDRMHEDVEPAPLLRRPRRTRPRARPATRRRAAGTTAPRPRAPAARR